MNKTKLRKKFISLRKNKNIFNIEIKKEILKIISNKFVFKNKTIAGYFPVNHEISIINLLKDLEKKNNKIVFPRIKNNCLSCNSPGGGSFSTKTFGPDRFSCENRRVRRVFLQPARRITE